MNFICTNYNPVNLGVDSWAYASSTCQFFEYSGIMYILGGLIFINVLIWFAILAKK